MKTIGKLIDKFKEFQEELNKNVNRSYSGQPNMVKGDPLPNAMAMSEKGETKHDRCAREVGRKGNVDNPHAVCVAAGVEPEKWKKSAKEKLTLAKNGQWSLGKADQFDENKGKSSVTP